MQQTPRHREATGGAKRLVWAVPMLALIAAAAVALPGFSSAAFTSRTQNAAGTVSAASDWTAPTVSVQALAATVRGTVTVTASASDADSGIKDVVLQHKASGASGWTTFCTDATAPYSCSLDTTALSNGSAELRAIATDKAANTTTSATVSTMVDNAAPSVTMTDPGSPLVGTKTFTATATDQHSGIAQVAIQASANGSVWTELCRVTSSPFSCSYDTTKLADGTYAFRAVATDKAGNNATSAAVTDRIVGNSAPAVTLADPGSYLYGTVAIDATASASVGVSKVVIERAPAGTGTWTTICSDDTAPYSCSWNTTQMTDGLYDLRAVVTDKAGRTATSVLTNRRIDNSAPRGVDVQASNCGTAGRFDAGDVITLTYSSLVDPNSISAGWNGTSPLAIQLNLRTRYYLFIFPINDILTFSQANGAAVNLGQIDLDTYFASGGGTNINGTLAMSTDASGRSVVTITVNGNLPRSYTGNTTLQWTPSASATGLNAKSVSGTTVTESGSADRDF